MMTKRSFEQLFREGTELLHRGKVEKALPMLEKAYGMSSDHPDLALNLSGAYIMSNRFKKAVPVLEVLIELEPENISAWTNLGAAYLGNPVLAQKEEQHRAIAAFRVAYSLNPAAPHVAYNIGLIYRDRNEAESAIFWFKKAIQANPADRDARSLLAKLEAAQGDQP